MPAYGLTLSIWIRDQIGPVTSVISETSEFSDWFDQQLWGDIILFAAQGFAQGQMGHIEFLGDVLPLFTIGKHGMRHDYVSIRELVRSSQLDAAPLSSGHTGLRSLAAHLSFELGQCRKDMEIEPRSEEPKSELQSLIPISY